MSLTVRRQPRSSEPITAQPKPKLVAFSPRRTPSAPSRHHLVTAHQLPEGLLR
jgi:hypothetical protein